jgi:MerR family transcriptional regulator, repressor of the yfmOP operon
MTADTQARSFRIGEVAERVGVTTRTIRYYEELGLLGAAATRARGAHRLYGEADVSRLQELLRLRDLLGLSLDELVGLAEAEESRAALRDRWENDPSDAERARIVEAAIPLVTRQIELVEARQRRLAEFAAELAGKLRSLEERRAELGSQRAAERRP